MRLAPALLFAAATAAVAVGQGGRSRPASPDSARASRPSPGFQYQGTASCAASACHHGNGPQGERGSEYTTWAGHDRHAQAYTVLLGPESRQIYRNLGPAAAAKYKAPHENPLCLNCHVLPNV